jgi:hypothetical protein
MREREREIEKGAGGGEGGHKTPDYYTELRGGSSERKRGREEERERVVLLGSRIGVSERERLV